MINPSLNSVTTQPVVHRPAPTPPKASPTEPKERFISSDMAQMLDDMERNGVLPARTEAPARPEPRGEMAVMLESIQRAEESYQSADLTGVKGQGSGSNPTTLMMLDEHHHPEGPQHAKLGTHLGLEVGEQVIHKVSHGASHAAEVAGNKAEVIGHVAEAASGKTGELAHHGAAVAHHTAQGTAHLSAAVATAAGIGAAGCGALGVVMLHCGINEIREGIKHKDAEHTLHGVGNTIVGVRSGLAGVSLAGMLAHGSEIVSAAAAGAQVLLAPLGVAHGAIDIGLGTKDIVVGVREKDQPKIVKGALSVGLGGALTAAALGGGIPALVVAGVFLGGKVVQSVRQKHAQENSSNAS